MEHLTYICEGYLFVYNPHIEYPQEVIGSFPYDNNIINIIATQGNNIEEIRRIASDDVQGIESIKNSIKPEILYAVKKIEHMSKKESVEPPFKIEFEEGTTNILFEGENILKVFFEEQAEQKYFYFPKPKDLSEKVEI